MFHAVGDHLVVYHRKLQGSHWCGAIITLEELAPAVLRGGDNPPGWANCVVARAVSHNHPLFENVRHPVVLFAEYSGVGGSAVKCDPVLDRYLREHFPVSRLISLARDRAVNLPWLSQPGASWSIEAARFLVDHAAWLEQN